MDTKRLLILSVVVVVGCTRGSGEVVKEGRWYKPSQVAHGKEVFEKHCAVCHGEHAQGAKNWKTPLPGGSYPPPPLNGTAHAWHHSLAVLKRTIDEGGAALGGKMPGFKGRVSEEENLTAIAYFQDMWSNDIYGMWVQRGGLD